MYTHVQVEHFHHSQKGFLVLHFRSSFPPLASGNQRFASSNCRLDVPFLEFHRDGLTRYVVFCVWLLSFQCNDFGNHPYFCIICSFLILLSVQPCLILILICTSMMTNDVKHFSGNYQAFMYFLCECSVCQNNLLIFIDLQVLCQIYV